PRTCAVPCMTLPCGARAICAVDCGDFSIEVCNQRRLARSQRRACCARPRESPTMKAMHLDRKRIVRRGRSALAIAVLAAGSMFFGPASAQNADADIVAARAAFDKGD